jgi:hypothetical protein
MTSAQARQMIGSLLAAVAIVAIVIVAVTIRLGTTSTAELDAREERQEERLKLREDLAKEREKLREERGR